MKSKALLITLVVAFPAASSLAQRPGGRPPGPPPGDAGKPPDRQNRHNQNAGDQQDGQQGGGQGKGEHPKGPPPPPPPILHALDTDDDGIISADEIKNAPESLAKLDKNKDKQLTPDELRPPPPPPPKDGQRGEKKADGDHPPKKPEGDQADKGDKGKKGPGDGPQGPPPPLIGALDTDHNGVISEEEISKASDSLLKLDKNGDGQLGPREYGMPPHPPGPPPKDGEKKPAE